MTYRDEHEAAHARVDALERELEAARREIAALRAGERPSPPPPRRFVAPPDVLVASACGAAAVGVALAIAAPSRPAPPAPLVPFEVVEPAPPRARAVTVEWHARVTDDSRGALRDGTRCALSASLRGDGAALESALLTVTCADGAVFSASDALRAAPGARAVDVEQEPAVGAGPYRYRLRFDGGARGSGGRYRILADTAARSLVVEDHGPVPGRIQMQVEELSEEWSGAGLFPAAR